MHFTTATERVVDNDPQATDQGELIRNTWSDQIIRALRDRYPEALAVAALERAA